MRLTDPARNSGSTRARPEPVRARPEPPPIYGLSAVLGRGAAGRGEAGQQAAPKQRASRSMPWSARPHPRDGNLRAGLRGGDGWSTVGMEHRGAGTAQGPAAARVPCAKRWLMA